MVGRKAGELSKSPNTQWSPVRLAALKDVNVVAVNKGSSSAFCFAVADDGQVRHLFLTYCTKTCQVYGWGRNEAGQLGLGDSKDRMVPSLVNELTGHTVVEIATGKSHTLFLTSEGKVLAAGSNDHGQLGQGKKSAGLETPQLVQHEGPSITSVAAGADFSVLLDKEGTVWTFGLPENGQLGHNDDGKFLAKANKVSRNANASV